MPIVKMPPASTLSVKREIGLKGRKWQKISKIFLARNPFCNTCKMPSRVVDHVDGDGNNNTLDNYQALCISCHSKKTWAEQNG
jgi:5-methylcytosine-specific restriction endonuclease McrA